MAYGPAEKRFLRKVGNQIRQLREQHGASQEAFSFECDIYRSFYGAIERGERNITLLTLRKIATALDVEPHKLLGTKRED